MVKVCPASMSLLFTVCVCLCRPHGICQQSAVSSSRLRHMWREKKRKTPETWRQKLGHHLTVVLETH